jgi:hypothetical protein
MSYDFRVRSHVARLNRTWGYPPKRGLRLYRYSNGRWGTLPYPRSATEFFDHLLPF